MGKHTTLIRIRFPLDVVERLDRLAKQLSAELKRKVPRAALIRALIQMYMEDAVEVRPDLANVLGADPVKRGRGTRTRRARSGAPS